MDIKKLEKIVKLLKEQDLQEIEIEEKDSRIRVKREVGPRLPQVVSAPQPPLAPEVVAVEEKKADKKPESPYKIIKSPMVGTLYRSPGPDAPAYVEEGTIVNKGQVLCIVEAMKLMNEIEAEMKGKIISILVENGQPVEYGEPLFEIEPLK
ncbi:MAG: acetyl-CoA carboxylase biotin carboxyl carrier protein [Proteobacteria bacterium]|nr:acetyl-CoA carboxylase biotin carboxyl carrier protein [Pseudomonadota bacterium]